MSTGPSKQELEMYWQSSRQYFDELAKHYQQADPEYYKNYILPFYNNPFQNTYAGGNKKSGGGAAIMIVAVIFLAVIGLGAALLFFVMNEDTSDIFQNDKKTEKQSETIEDTPPGKEIEKETTGDKKTKDTEKDTEDEDGLSSEDHFIIGSKKISEKDYDNAEHHLKKVKPGSQYYKQAQELLKNMKFLRQFNK